MNKRIYLASPHMSDEGFELEYIHDAFEKNWIAPMGENVNEFERELAAKVGAKAAVALSSGTAAIHMALKAVGVGIGDIVFCPSLTFAATANPIIYENATPVFIDSDFETWNMSPGALERAFEKYAGRVKAVLVVHLYGLSADLDRICETCKRHNVPLIEDAAESLGSTYKGRYTGTFGEYGIYSFNGNKIITTSGGGMLVANNDEGILSERVRSNNAAIRNVSKTAKEKIAKVRFWATQSRDPARHYQHSELGYNYRMSNISAGIGRGQLKVLDKRIKKKRYIFNYYREAFKEISDIQMMPVNEWNEPNYWLSCIVLKGDDIKPLDIIEVLEKEDIESRPIWKPLHLQPFFKGYDFIDNGWVAEKIFENGICLPSDTKMTEDDLNIIIRLVKRLWR